MRGGRFVAHRVRPPAVTANRWRRPLPAGATGPRRAAQRSAAKNAMPWSIAHT
ncbi:hypothetical protein OH687_31220 [Burkholderia anthina]|nr:hypothetical protein OH687_31220 [Burkholderia anthina]